LGGQQALTKFNLGIKRKKSMNIATNEVIRLFVIPLLGLMLMFFIQPILFMSNIFRLSDVRVQTWVNSHYMPAAGIVFAFSLLAILIWIGWNVKSPPASVSEAFRRQGPWWFLSLIPIFGIVISIVLSRQGILAPKGSNDATVYLGILFFLDVAVLYWLTTATSTPGLARGIPPGSHWFKR
jgi:hypothetical protein